ncbi:glycosyltransferase family 2 protein [Photobacterium indicum]|nr:glycosyltransferase family 2 protein [Photobacterium indicum]
MIIDNELVSIIMPAHNASKHIMESIDSVLAQTYVHWELVIINDRSVDKTLDIIEKYSLIDERVKFFSNTLDQGGAYLARNIGLKKASGKFIAFLDSDDRWHPRKLEVQLSEMQRLGYHACHTSYVRVSDTGSIINSVQCKRHVTYKDQLKTNHIPNLTGLYNREVLGTILQKNIGHEDYDMWLVILSMVPSLGIKEKLAYYRVADGSLSSNKFKSAMWHYKILHSQGSISFLYKQYYFLFYIYFALLKRL